MRYICIPLLSPTKHCQSTEQMNHFANGKLNYCRVDFLHYLIHNNITKPTIDTTLAPILTLNKTRVHFHLRPTNATSFLPSQRLININSGVKSLIGKLVAATDPSVLLLIQANPSIHPTTQSLALILDLKNSNLRTNTTTSRIPRNSIQMYHKVGQHTSPSASHSRFEEISWTASSAPLHNIHTSTTTTTFYRSHNLSRRNTN